MREEQIAEIVEMVRKSFRSMGGGEYTTGNPLSFAMADQPPQFALGVDIKQVVQFVLGAEKMVAKKAKAKPKLKKEKS